MIVVFLFKKWKFLTSISQLFLLYHESRWLKDDILREQRSQNCFIDLKFNIKIAFFFL